MASKKETIRILFIIFSLLITLGFFLQSILIWDITQELTKFLIAISLSMTGLGIIAFQLDKNKKGDLKKTFLNFSIIMICSGLIGIAYLIYPNLLLDNFNLGHLSAVLFIWGVFLLLTILIEERFLENIK